MSSSLAISAASSTQRPTYGYRRIAALLKRERRSDGLAPVNAKRVYRLMKKHGLLLERHTGRRRPREHDGQVATIRSNCRWCSDALEFTCWNGEVVRVAFALDCHDREVISWVATTAGISGEMIRDMMVRCCRATLRHDPRAAAGAVAIRQRLDLRRPQNHRDRRGAQPGAVLHPGRKPGKQRHGRGFREDLQARLRPGQARSQTPLLPLLSSIAGWRTTTPFTRIPDWVIDHPANTSFPNPLRVRFNGVNSRGPG